MTYPQERESRPGGNGAAITNYEGDTSSLTDPTVVRHDDDAPALTAGEVYEIVRGRLVVHVIVKDQRQRVTVRPYRNVGAADRAARRAVERGCAATVVMVRQDVAPLIGGGL